MTEVQQKISDEKPISVSQPRSQEKNAGDTAKRRKRKSVYTPKKARFLKQHRAEATGDERAARLTSDRIRHASGRKIQFVSEGNQIAKKCGRQLADTDTGTDMTNTALEYEQDCDNDEDKNGENDNDHNSNHILPVFNGSSS